MSRLDEILEAEARSKFRGCGVCAFLKKNKGVRAMLAEYAKRYEAGDPVPSLTAVHKAIAKSDGFPLSAAILRRHMKHCT